MTMPDHVQLFVLYCTDYCWSCMAFANFVEQYLVPYEYASISLVVVEASMWLL